MWYVYIMECADKTLYTGVTTEIKRRLLEHNDTDKGAKYTRPRRPVKLVYSRRFKNRINATREERRIKKLSRSKKLEIIASKEVKK